ncbi:MAG: BamA/TamA family outer membrane protein [Desulfosarcina sp.]|nr:BamA/TamA family outer membrane protein [Desulfobacterales bacterium]
MFFAYEGGYIDDRGRTPDYEKFFIGGMETVRGVESSDVSPHEDSNDSKSALVGGEAFVAFNHEVHYPLGESLGLVGVVFMDFGDLWRNTNDIDLAFSDMVKTAGGGVRWLSPMGPLRVEYGHVVDSGDTNASGGKFEFTMGGNF